MIQSLMKLPSLMELSQFTTFFREILLIKFTDNFFRVEIEGALDSPT